MKRRIAVFTADEYLYQKIYLTLTPTHECERLFGARSDGFDLCLFDARGGERAPVGAPTVTMSQESGELKIPFSRAALLKTVEGADDTPPLSLGERCAYLKGECVKLSELELSLLTLLMRAGGEFVSREEILERVWHSEKSAGIINVYIHYLREKLESHGEKIIISSRTLGYKIDGRFLKRR